jgi:NADH dehydrogenase
MGLTTERNMVLVTGATGFIGRRVAARLSTAGYVVRCLVRPAYKERRLPPGVSVHMVAGDLANPPALRVALQNVDAVVHLASIWIERGSRTFESVNYQGTLALLEAAKEVGVAGRFVFASYPGADRNSAYAFLRSKGLAEEVIKSSGLHYTILRPSWVYGPDDGWTTLAAMTLKSVPFVCPVVGDGQTRLQPLWVDDLARCVEQCLGDPKTADHVYALGGPGYFTFNDALDVIAQSLKVRKRKVFIRLPLAYSLAGTFERLLPRPLLTKTMVDLLGVDTTTELGSVLRTFGFEPARFAATIGYLHNQPWRRRFLRRLLGQS